MQNNYFVCTLGQAARPPVQSKPYRNISEFIHQQAQHHPELPAVGFPVPRPNQRWNYKVLTFNNVDHGTNVFAARLSNSMPPPRKSETIALICHSSPEFLFTWLGLIRLGFSVLLIAPQCQPAAIQHLCTSCNVSTLLYDAAHAERAQRTESLTKATDLPELQTQLLPLDESEDIFRVIEEQPQSPINSPQIDEMEVAYLHHTSGTSSGLPKPIPQTHRAAIGVLPHLPTIPVVASFTTTPLYHGGIADLFRCWTSNALIWLFPGKDVPITAQNICSCLTMAEDYASTAARPTVKYFSSVPYVLQMMEADGTGLQYLQSMDIVGVGGAALPAEVGDRLVRKNVNLISRFGSAECGFLLSSFRDFTSDKDWQYLRDYNPPKFIEFEARDNDLAELIIKPAWPHMAKKNRDDGSYATADLFAPHPSIQHAWLYHSRADSQLTLLTGKKFDPAPLEDAIATSSYLDDVLIFGNDRPYPGALLLRSEQAKNTSDQELLNAITPAVRRLNEESQDHARISVEMLIPVPHQEQPLEKSSKGTIIRRAAEARFAELIKNAYESEDAAGSCNDGVKDEDLSQHLKNLIQKMTSQSGELTEDLDLFSYGVDSIACMRLRSQIRQLIPNHNGALPMSVIEDCGTIGRLKDFILRKRHGEADAGTEDEQQLMRDLVRQYGLSDQSSTEGVAIANACKSEDPKGEVVILTGATGALGAHILNLLQHATNVDVIYCLVRGTDEQAARERVSKALEQRGFESLFDTGLTNDKVKVLPAQLSDDRLGLKDDTYNVLAKQATSIIHVAWTVNFRLKLRSFVQDNIAGVRNLLNLALQSGRSLPPRFTYCSSTASIMNGKLDPTGYLPERILSEPSSSSPLGYSQSKWVAEHICAEAHKRTRLRGRLSVVRVGQLAGDSVAGVWNTKEAWPMMLSTAHLIHCLPDLNNEPLDWLPVDIAAKAFVETTAAEGASGDELPIFHVLNPHLEPTWHDMLQWLRKKETFEIVDPKEWVRRLEECSETNHSALKLLGLWKEAYGPEAQAPTDAQRPRFSMVETQKKVPTLRDVKPLDEAYVDKIWRWVRANVQ
ncbi:hypothetical protein ACN47E_001211 [Coniothyrium glycines]